LTFTPNGRIIQFSEGKRAVRDEYVGDIGDFGKYILLRELSAINSSNIKVGINWYYNTRPEGASGYLSSKDSDDYQNLDGQLFDRLKDIVTPCRRTVYEIEKTGVLPNISLYYRAAIPYSAAKATDRKIEREDWFENSLNALTGANVVFLDPDNGIETPTAKITKTDAVKYAFLNEIDRYYEADKSVIIYNHRDHKELTKFAEKCMELKSRVGLHSNLQRDISILKFTKFQSRYYVFVPRLDKHNKIFKDLFKILTKKYDYLFERDEELDDIMTSLSAK
jgi:hypothetical protein